MKQVKRYEISYTTTGFDTQHFCVRAHSMKQAWAFVQGKIVGSITGAKAVRDDGRVFANALHHQV